MRWFIHFLLRRHHAEPRPANVCAESWRRFKLRCHGSAVVLGVCMMLLGSFFAHNAHAIAAVIHFPHIVLDAFGYFIHGCGMIPLLNHIEPLWVIFAGSE